MFSFSPSLSGCGKSNPNYFAFIYFLSIYSPREGCQQPTSSVNDCAYVHICMCDIYLPGHYFVYVYSRQFTVNLQPVGN